MADAAINPFFSSVSSISWVSRHGTNGLTQITGKGWQLIIYIFIVIAFVKKMMSSRSACTYNYDPRFTLSNPEGNNLIKIIMKP